jgi:lycopene beta-cyclase
MPNFDIIIAGGGCAGLSLAYQLINSPLADRSILIVDRDDKDQNDRTWAYWSDRPTPFQEIVRATWDRLRFTAPAGAPAGDHIIPTDDWQYAMIRGDDFYRHIRDLLAARPNVTWIKAAVKRIEDGADGATVWLDLDGPGPAGVEAYHGAWVFDSLFNILHFKPDGTRYRHLQQHFKGWFIETPTDAFDPTAATIFDFRTPQDGELRFFYVLPISPREALVEYVGLSLVDYDALLDRYVREVLGIAAYRIISDEIGVTPLTDYPFPRQRGRHIMATGIQGGLVKPTTGYAYTRIQDDATAIVRSLLAHGHPFDVPTSSWLYRWLDSVMLEVMAVEPECLGAAFQTMFSRNPGPRIFRFLDERATARDIVGLVLSLPRLPFVAGAARLALRGARVQMHGLSPLRKP